VCVCVCVCVCVTARAGLVRLEHLHISSLVISVCIMCDSSLAALH